MKILWVPHTGWHIPQRAHLFCRALAVQHQVHVTDWVADFSKPSDYFSRRYLQNFTYRCYHDAKITVHGIPRISPALFSARLRRFNTSIFSRYVDRIIDRYGIEVVVGTFVLPPPKAPKVVFDLFDDNVAHWRAYSGFEPYAREIENHENQYYQKADQVVAASPVLLDSAKKKCPSKAVHFIPNGVDIARYQAANREHNKQKLGLTGKVIGSVGSHDRMYELEKILYAAKEFRNDPVTFLIAGRGSALPEAKQKVERENLKNVRFTGFFPMAELPEKISVLDIGLCPYKKTKGTDASMPMRLISYSATGIPVVCTDLLSVRMLDFPNVLLVEDTNQAFVAGIKCALNIERDVPKNIDEFDIHRLADKYNQILSA